MGTKQDELDNYLSLHLDSLQVQINMLKNENEQLKRRLKRLNNRFAIHLNDNQGHNHKVGSGGIMISKKKEAYSKMRNFGVRGSHSKTIINSDNGELSRTNDKNKFIDSAVKSNQTQFNC